MTDTIEKAAFGQMALTRVVNRWTNAEEIRLRAGEIDTETMRTVLAVTRGFAAEVLEWELAVFCEVLEWNDGERGAIADWYKTQYFP